ncbi:sugar transferase [Planktomarina sp.]|nr:sugar transferase [Planktomarina sp.]
MLKKTFDITLCILLIPIFLPIGIVVACLIYVLQGRPIFFSQKRVGKKGRIFVLYKFRSMQNRTGENAFEHEDKDRMTRLGMFLRSVSLDEIPQILNIIIGDMSFIGPRPLLPEYLPLYSRFQRRRHEVLPGITGWAQIKGRNELSWDKKFELDVWYVDNQTFWIDVKIVFFTIIKVILRTGISAEGQATMQKFKGDFD